jgi:hypothetical protein
MLSKFAVGASLLVVLLAQCTKVIAQKIDQGKWADETDPVAKQLIEMERKWATVTCDPGNLPDVAAFIADDFVGTHPNGSIYTKPALPHKGSPAPAIKMEHDCKLLSARVRFYGPNIATIYGSESALAKGTNGKASPRILIWTDTLLRRGGHWQVIAVQDMIVPTR